MLLKRATLARLAAGWLPRAIVVPLLAAALLAACGPAAAPVSTPVPGPAADQRGAAATPEQVLQALKLEEARGHLAASLANLQAGRPELAAAHAAHPLQESLPSFEETLQAKNADLAARLRARLMEQVRFAGSQPEAGQYAAGVAETNRLLDQARDALVPAEVSGSLAFQGQVMAALADTAATEYGEGVVDGSIKEAEEYQDGYGFFQQVLARWSGLEDRVRAAAPDRYTRIEELLGQLQSAFPGVVPPAAPVASERVEDWARRLIGELAAATGFSEQALSATGSEAPAQLSALAGKLAPVRAALEAGQLPAARQAYQEFDDGWFEIEDGVRARSRDAYRGIEQAMDEVKTALLRAEQPDRARALTALEQLDQTIQSTLRGWH